MSNPRLFGMENKAVFRLYTTSVILVGLIILISIDGQQPDCMNLRVLSTRDGFIAVSAELVE